MAINLIKKYYNTSVLKDYIEQSIKKYPEKYYAYIDQMKCSRHIYIDIEDIDKYGGKNNIDSFFDNSKNKTAAAISKSRCILYQIVGLEYNAYSLSRKIVDAQFKIYIKEIRKLI